MQAPTITQERLPVVWTLSGLLLVAVGLLVGFDSKAAIGAMIGGLLFAVFGLMLFVLQLQERPRQSARTRLSPEFISAGSEAQTSAPAPQAPSEPAPEEAAAK